tara:strand:+ start:255 stop:494 length:240 start_codon:yes stop_codon:yes gene_type:complete
MTTQEIYSLANGMTEQEALNVVLGWKQSKEKKCVQTFNSLVSLGDSKQLACATVIAGKINTPFKFTDEVSEFYRTAYES